MFHLGARAIKKEKYNESVRRSFRSHLNSLFESGFKKDPENLESLKFAIHIEDLILKSNFYIDYYIPNKGSNKGQIMRADDILNKKKGMTQDITILEKYGHLVSDDLSFKRINRYNYGKIAFNTNTYDIGIIRGYYDDNTKTRKRYKVDYCSIGDSLTIKTSDWNEEYCKVYNSKDKMILGVEDELSMHPEINKVLEHLDFKMGILKYRGK